HGRFGPTVEWPNVSAQILGWLGTNRPTVGGLVDMLAVGAPVIGQARDELVEWACGGILAARIGEVFGEPGADMLSEALAVGGVLPLFGFPTMVRSFHHGQPRALRGQVQYEAVDWDADVCVSAFA